MQIRIVVKNIYFIKEVDRVSTKNNPFSIFHNLERVDTVKF